MSTTVYALLVGIDAYPRGVRPLEGCVNDVTALSDYLRDRFGPSDLALEVLTDGDATRERVMETFRSHLGRAGADDVALFAYSGHGARSPSAPEFRATYPDGRDEGLVMVDSRVDGRPDLADKELAVLLHEIARNDPHLAVILDCCHSGSGTRTLEEMTGAVARFTGAGEPRPIEDYVGGYYADRLSAGQPLTIPKCRHILLAACDRWQTAKEVDGEGIFSATLRDVLGTASAPTYADLFARSRVAVKRRARDQDPQFDSYLGFNAYRGFLGGEGGRGSRATVAFTDGAWTMDRGAFAGLSTDPERPVHVEIYEGDHHVSSAVTSSVHGARSMLDLEREPDRETTYEAEITDLPVAPLGVHVAAGSTAAIEALRDRLDETPSVVLVDDIGANYSIGIEPAGDGEAFVLLRAAPPLRVEGIRASHDEPDERALDHMVYVLDSAARFERLMTLSNRRRELAPASVDLSLRVHPGEAGEYRDEEGQVTIVYRSASEDDDQEWEDVTVSIEATNRHRTRLHVALFYFSEVLGVHTLFNEPLEPGATAVLYAPTGEADDAWEGKLHLADGRTENEDVFRLFVSTEAIPHQEIEQADVPLSAPRSRDAAERGIGPTRKNRRQVESGWFTKSIHVRGIGQSDEIGTENTTVGDGRVVVRGHPSFTARISLTPAGGNGRDPVAGMHRALEPLGFELVDVSGERSAEGGGSVLELIDIQNDATLADDPLEIELDLGLTEDDCVLPVAFDGRHFLVVGQPSREEGGRVVLAIDRVPDSRLPDGRRSLGKALKLYLMRTYLKRTVDQLCWVEFGPDGSVERHDEGVSERVAAASDVLLLVHGIIGDTKNIAEGVGRLETTDGTPLREAFDLVLTFDYENLGREIEATSKVLRAALESAGFSPDDGKRLTVLAHSMGGLVSRHLIEQHDGDDLIDHLAMCGTPNGGSPFGKVGTARSLLRLLTTAALNVPALASVAAPLTMVLTRSKKLSVTLEQMDAASPFLTGLSAPLETTAPAGLRYTVLAGDLSAYRLDADGLSLTMLDVFGGGLALRALHGTEHHDIAVSADSIRNVEGGRGRPLVRTDVACHHLNYFSSPAGLDALSEVQW